MGCIGQSLSALFEFMLQSRKAPSIRCGAGRGTASCGTGAVWPRLSDAIAGVRAAASIVRPAVTDSCFRFPVRELLGSSGDRSRGQAMKSADCLPGSWRGRLFAAARGSWPHRSAKVPGGARRPHGRAHPSNLTDSDLRFGRACSENCFSQQGAHC